MHGKPPPMPDVGPAKYLIDDFLELGCCKAGFDGSPRALDFEGIVSYLSVMYDGVDRREVRALRDMSKQYVYWRSKTDPLTRPPWRVSDG